MATNIEMNLYNGSDYTVLYPKTAASNLDGALTDSQIPSLDASKITSGSFATSRIPNLSATKITSGTLPVSRGGTGNTSLSGLASDLSSYLDTGSSNPNVSNATGILPISHGGTGQTTASKAIYGLTNGLTARTASQVNSYASSTYLPCYYSTTGYKMPISALLTYIQNNASMGNSDFEQIEYICNSPSESGAKGITTITPPNNKKPYIICISKGYYNATNIYTGTFMYMCFTSTAFDFKISEDFTTITLQGSSASGINGSECKCYITWINN